MRPTTYFLKLLGLPFVFGLVRGTTNSTLVECKCVPQEPCWPPNADFEQLNETVSGRLIQTIPPASVCYQGQPNYDRDACAQIRREWTDSAFHADDPTSISYPIWANNSCPPIWENGTSVTGDPNAGKKGCSVGDYPVYAVNATHPAHVQAMVQFAKKKNIRLILKNTGHSISGRSTAFGSISIYTHHYRGIEFHSSFQPQGCPINGTQMAATIAAGEQDIDVYTELSRYNAVVVGGSAKTVGLAGWFTGGGHGPLSSEYGMGVDNVLEVTMVTLQGDVVTANACQHPDLFWAIRGGGGGTFGIVLSVVMKAYPTPQTTYQGFKVSFHSNDTAKTWYKIADVLSELPRLKSAGVQGYFSIKSPPMVKDTELSWGFLLYNKPDGTFKTLMEPIDRKLTQDPGWLTHGWKNTSFPTFYDAWSSYIGPEPVASSGVAMGGRLLPEAALTSDVMQLGKALRKASTPDPGGYPVIVSGEMTANSKNCTLDNALNPAWRDAVVNYLVVQTFPDSTSAAERKKVHDNVTFNRTAALKSLAPESGAYFNEADPYDPDFQYSFWSKNYPRLRALKEKYDPYSVLWCLSCVGSETWTQKEDGRLCREPWVAESLE